MGSKSIIFQDDIQMPNPFTFRNKIINGDMRIQQRYSGAKFTNTIASSYQYAMDRFAMYIATIGEMSAEVFSTTISDSPFLYGISTYGRFKRESAVGAALDINIIGHGIEGYNISDLNFGTTLAKQFTISFWARASGSYNFSLSLCNTTTGASRTYVIPFDVTTTWKKYTYTVTADTTGSWGTGNSLGLHIRFVLGGGGVTTSFNQWKGDNLYVGGSTQFQTLATNSYIDITGLQLEPGTVATPFADS